MPVYDPVPAYADGKRHPRALVLIVAGHAGLLAAVMTAKMDLPSPFAPTKTDVTMVPLPAAPPQDRPQPPEKPRKSVIDQVPRLFPVPQPVLPPIYTTPLPLPDPGPMVQPGPPLDSRPPVPIRRGPRFVTPESQVKPPYPQRKLRLEEEAVLRLRLTIDERGRVTSVSPVGRADPVFLSAARRHLIAHWRYQPATEGDRPIASSTVITLRFAIDD